MYRWDELTHRSVGAYRFRQRYIMEPFKRIAARTPWYDERAATAFVAAREELWRRYLSDATVLEVGCGPGSGSVEATVKYGARGYVGSDLSVGMVCDARRAHPTFGFVAGRAEALPFRDGQYDAVWTSYTMHHLPPAIRPKALAEMARVSKGVLLIEDVYGFPSGLKRHLYEAYYRLADGCYYRDTLDEWRDVFKLANLRIVEHLDSGDTTVVYRRAMWVVRP